MSFTQAAGPVAVHLGTAQTVGQGIKAERHVAQQCDVAKPVVGQFGGDVRYAQERRVPENSR